MKEKILAFLKSKIQGGQEAYLTGVAETYSKTISEESQIETVLNESVLGLIKFNQDFLQSETDRRVAGAVQSYEKKHSLKDGKPISKGGEDKPAETDDDKDVPKWAKVLIDQNKELSGKLAAIETEKKQNDLFSKLKTKLTKDLEIPEKDITTFNLLKGVSVKEETDIETVAESIKTTYETSLQELKDRGVSIVKPKEGQGGGGGLIDDIKNWGKEKQDEKEQKK